MIMIIIIGILVLGLFWWVSNLHAKIDILEVYIKSIEKGFKLMSLEFIGGQPFGIKIDETDK